VQSRELPLPALRRQAPRWARGWAGGWGTQGPLPDPAHALGPICEKSRAVPRREAGSAPHPSLHKLWVNQVLPVESPSYWIMGVAVIEVADWVFVWSPPALVAFARTK
jgi:hypothetical protein